MIVVDTNVIGYLYLTSERSAQSERALQKDSGWVAPRLWRSEFRNMLALYLRKRLLTLADALAILDEAETLMRDGECEVVSTQVLELAQASEMSAYDCEFVALAHDLGVPLVTVDGEIVRRFPGTAVSLDAFIGT